jgi:hypothetical protein
MGLDNSLMDRLTTRAKTNPKRIIFAEADHYKILKAAQVICNEGIGKPILLGNREKINEICEEYDEYEGKRARVYPFYLDQLDMLFHDIDQGLFGAAAKTGDFYTSIKAVKDANQ